MYFTATFDDESMSRFVKLNQIFIAQIILIIHVLKCFSVGKLTKILHSSEFCPINDDLMITKYILNIYSIHTACFLNYLLAFSCFIIFCSWQVSKTMKEDADEDIAKYDG